MNSSLQWTSQFRVGVEHSAQALPGDKILLPPAALEELLAAAPVITNDETSTDLPHRSSFDPYNPYSYAAERHARAQTRYQHQQLPHPLTFRLVNPATGRIVYAGIKEFSAEEGQIVLSTFLIQALGLESPSRPFTPGDSAALLGWEDETISEPFLPSADVTVHVKQLPRGTFVKFRPLEAGYDPEDWKSLLEDHLRKNYTTLTKGEVLTIPAGRSGPGTAKSFQLLVDELRPESDGICIVDTDLEVDIEALNEEQARETMRQIASRMQRQPGTAEGSSSGGQLDLFRSQEGQVIPGEYVDYEIPSWDRSATLAIELKPVSDEDDLELFASPFGSYQRAKPRDDEHLFSAHNSCTPKRISLAPTNAELDDAEALWVSVHAPLASSTASTAPRRFTVRVMSLERQNPLQDDALPNGNGPTNADEVQCKNCLQYVPQRTLMLHENFCLRNNILCPKGCGNVFQKRSEAWQNHWHCPHDTYWGNTHGTHDRHESVFHVKQSCPNCNHIALSLEALAHHRATTCPGKLILCRFCHLVLPQEGDPDGIPSAEVLLSGLTPHELADGARTTECHMCQRIVRLRDMATHLKHHDLERHNRPSPRICRNVNCGRTLDGTSAGGDTRLGTRMGQGPGNEIGLCSTCFGPLYVSMYDPDGKALKRRVERRYLSQLLTGCAKSWCRNEFCKTGRQHINPGGAVSMTTKDALPVIKPIIDGLAGNTTSLHFCVDESSQKRKVLAQMMAAQDQGPGSPTYGLDWCTGAVEAEGGNLDRSMEWLKNFAPAQAELRA